MLLIQIILVHKFWSQDYIIVSNLFQIGPPPDNAPASGMIETTKSKHTTFKTAYLKIL